MRDVVVIGVGMTEFGKFPEKSLKDLARTAVWKAIRDANVPPKQIQVAYVGNSIAGLITGQEAVRGQVMLRDAGLGGLPVINVENACASGSTAFRGAWLEVASGNVDVALALGVEKLFLEDTARTIAAMATGSDLDLVRSGFQFSAYYAMNIRRYMADFGATKEQFAKVVVKNSYNGSLNPYAQHRKPMTVEAVVNSRLVAPPLTLYMCSSIGDGAAAAILCSREAAAKYGATKPVQVAACNLRSGMWRPPEESGPFETVAITAKGAYEAAGVGPDEIDVAEVHDAMAPAELMLYEELGFCHEGEGGRLIDDGQTNIGGRLPVNTSGGLTARGHPVGATGLAQITEIVWQLRGDAGPRQVAGAKVGLTENAGGRVDDDNAACCVTILKA